MGAPEHLLLQRILPAYEGLGPISFAWAQGSVVSGYTSVGDYDVIVAWDLEKYPVERSSVVSRLDERDPGNPFVVNHRDISIDRLVIEGQEFNIGHATLEGFRKFHVEPVLQGVAFRDESILQPVIAVSGFYYGKVLVDHEGKAARTKEMLDPFPPRLREEALRMLRVRRSALSTTRSLGERGDWITYFRDLAEILRKILLALFSSHDVYYPGDKWVLPAFARFSIESGAGELWGEIWQIGASPSDTTAAAESLAALAESQLTERVDSR